MTPNYLTLPDAVTLGVAWLRAKQQSYASSDLQRSDKVDAGMNVASAVAEHCWELTP